MSNAQCDGYVVRPLIFHNILFDYKCSIYFKNPEISGNYGVRISNPEIRNFFWQFSFLFVCEHFFNMYILLKWFFLQKVLHKRMVFCNFDIVQHNLAPSRDICQKLPILMVNKLVKNWTVPKSLYLVKLTDLCLYNGGIIKA